MDGRPFAKRAYEESEILFRLLRIGDRERRDGRVEFRGATDIAREGRGVGRARMAFGEYFPAQTAAGEERAAFQLGWPKSRLVIGELPD